MSDDLHHRVGGLENWQARTDERIAHIEAGVDEIKVSGNETKDGVRQLLLQNAQRPDPASWRTVLVTLVTCLAAVSGIGGFVWYIVETSPAVRQLDARLTELDHPRIGRMSTIERKIGTLGGWRSRVIVRGDRRTKE